MKKRVTGAGGSQTLDMLCPCFGRYRIGGGKT
jgi:hypothetical protein